MGQLDGRVAMITGGGEGIGRGIAAAYLKAGARVVIAEFNEPLGIKTAADLSAETGGEAKFVLCDVGVKEQVEAAVKHTVEQFGTIDILVNNAWSGGELSRIENKSDELLQYGFKIGYWGPWWAMKTAFPVMKAQGYGRVINLCSLNGVNAHIGSAEYNSAKEALRALSRRTRAAGGAPGSRAPPVRQRSPRARHPAAAPGLGGRAGQPAGAHWQGAGVAAHSCRWHRA